LMYKLSIRSLTNLVGVHPDLQMVVKRAIEITQYDFGVVSGVRRLEQQKEYLAQGKTTTLKSMHLPQPDGFGHAVDLVVYVNGKPTWEHKYFRKVVQAIFTAAIELRVQVTAGALWRDFLDSPHIELNQHYYK
jgi:peptidoglycan L-alanyl-D-glutamate endopeptidase CwlK